MEKTMTHVPPPVAQGDQRVQETLQVQESSCWNFKRIATVSAIAILIIGVVFIPAAAVALSLKPDGSATCEGDYCELGNTPCQRMQQLNSDNNYLPTPHDYCVGEDCPPDLIASHEITPINFDQRTSELQCITNDAIGNAHTALVTQGSISSWFSTHGAVEDQVGKLQEARDELACVGRELGKIERRLDDHNDYYSNWEHRSQRGYYAGKRARDLHAYNLNYSLGRVCKNLFDLCVRAAHASWSTVTQVKWLKCAVEQINFMRSGGDGAFDTGYSTFNFNDYLPEAEKGISCLEKLAELEPETAQQSLTQAEIYRQSLARWKEYKQAK